MLLLIDNYDSFTYNLYQYLSELGAETLVRRNDAVTLAEIECMAPERIVISPGPGSPAQAGISTDVVLRFGHRIPILGVCLGHQCIGHAFGGVVSQAEDLVHGKSSLIYHGGAGVLKNLPSPFPAARYHSLVVDRSTLPECLEITARTATGVIMGLRHRRLSIQGVQFHPESILTVVGKDLLRNFLNGGATGD
ncbi:MAG: anthranilate synthase component II [Chloroflexota bacterium]